jgi:hypothetical protein
MSKRCAKCGSTQKVGIVSHVLLICLSCRSDREGLVNWIERKLAAAMDRSPLFIKTGRGSYLQTGSPDACADFILDTLEKLNKEQQFDA